MIKKNELQFIYKTFPLVKFYLKVLQMKKLAATYHALVWLWNGWVYCIIILAMLKASVANCGQVEPIVALYGHTWASMTR